MSSPKAARNANFVHRPDEQVHIWKVVLTGGPCGGKTTALARLTNYLRERGFRVYTVPEAATMFWSNGHSFSDLGTSAKRIVFQSNLLQTQICLENVFYNLAKSTGQKSVLLCDRGVMDGSAYMDESDWKEVLKEMKVDAVELRDTRYDSVFHLVTAANGAEKHYGDETNTTRYESLDGARDVDKKLQLAWIGHPRVFVFDNSTDFEGKMQRTIAAINRLCGLPSTQKAFRRFLISPPPKELPVKCEVFDVTKVYVLVKETDHFASHDAFSFIRKRAKGMFASYGLTDVRVDEFGNKIESKRILNAREYESYLKFKDESRHQVKVKRTSFLYEDTYYEVNEYESPNSGLTFVNVQLVEGVGDESLSVMPKFPPFLSIIEEITDSEKYSAYELSVKPKD